MNKRVIYLVEGDCEKSLIQALKESPSLLLPGKIIVNNPVNSLLSKGVIMTFAPNSTIVLVFDTDVERVDVLARNLELLERYNASYEIVTIPQIKTFEDEIVRATDVKKATELTHSKTLSDFKRDIVKTKDLRRLLEKHSFDIDSLWAKEAKNVFSFVKQLSGKIKTK